MVQQVPLKSGTFTILIQKIKNGAVVICHGPQNFAAGETSEAVAHGPI